MASYDHLDRGISAGPPETARRRASALPQNSNIIAGKSRRTAKIPALPAGGRFGPSIASGRYQKCTDMQGKDLWVWGRNAEGS